MNLSKKNIIVTGANRGIGASTVNILHKYGANVICCSRILDKNLIEKSEKINKSSENKIYNYFFDLSKENEVILTAKKISEDFEKIDGLVNNAGVNHVSLFLMDKIEDIKKVFEINFFSQLVFSQIIIKKMIKNKSGSVIFLSSKAAVDSVVGRLAYASSKSSLINSTKILSKELGRFNIRVNGICPGLVNTDMLNNQIEKEELEKLKKSIPLNKIGLPEDVAELISFLCSDQSNYINGQMINIDGGQ